MTSACQLLLVETSLDVPDDVPQDESAIKVSLATFAIEVSTIAIIPVFAALETRSNTHIHALNPVSRASTRRPLPSVG